MDDSNLPPFDGALAPAARFPRALVVRPDAPRGRRCHRADSAAATRTDPSAATFAVTTRPGRPYVRAMSQQRLTLGHSPDPDDAFMFYGLAKELVPTHGVKFEHILQDIQTLNERAALGE